MAMRGPDCYRAANHRRLVFWFASGLSQNKNKCNGVVSLRDVKSGPRISMRGFSVALMMQENLHANIVPHVAP
jgi:hypothetical protein